MMIRSLFRGAVVGAACLLAMASCSTNGRIKKTRNGVVVAFDQCKMKVQVCSARIVRVVFAPSSGGFDKPKSLVVDRKWRRVPWTLEWNSDSLTVSTELLKIRVSVSDGGMVFSDASGNVLLRPCGVDSGSLKPAVVQGEATHHARQRFLLSPDEGLYGLGQFQDGVMDWRGKDALLVQANRIAVNPFLVSTKRYGILWDNYSKTWFHDGPDGMCFRSEVGDRVDYTFVFGSTLDEVIAGYREATGQAPLFPKWAYGYFQSKERYRTAAELDSVAWEFRDRRIPLDCLVQDWQYWGDNDRWSGMVWTPDRFPDPKGLIDRLHNVYHVRLMNSIWPAVGMKTGLYRELRDKGFVFDRRHWSGGRLYDAYSPAARDIYWKYLNRGLFSIGVDAFWMDATEPELTSAGDRYITEFEIKACGSNALGTFSRFLNPYSLMTTKGVYENWRKTTRDKRPFILTRSSFTGQQRYAAVTWSGDIGSNWDVLRRQISAGVNFCMAGIPYWTTDIGAFLPDSQGGMYPQGGADPAFRELYVRWFQFGAFCPVFRSHGTGTPREPWRFGEPGSPNYEAILKYDNLRYRLLPYTYSTAARVTKDGYTLMRGLAMDFPDEPNARGVDDEFLFGPSILVCPVTREMFSHTKKQEDLIPPCNLFTPDGEEGALRVEFFKGQDLRNRVQDLRMVEIALNWIGILPEAVLDTDYSVRWTGDILSGLKGRYQFVLRSDGGYRIWAGGRKLLDRWNHEGPSIGKADMVLNAGSRIPIRIEHRQPNPGMVNFKFEWIPPKRPEAAVKNGIECFLPAGADWVDFWTGKRLGGGRRVFRETPIDIMPLYVRAGSIVPMGPFLQYADEKPADPLEVRVYHGADASFVLYEDEGDNLNYEMGSYAFVPFVWDEDSQILTIGKRNGGFPGMLKDRILRVVWVGEGHGTGVVETTEVDAEVRYAGQEVVVKKNR